MDDVAARCRALESELAELRAELARQQTWKPPGHYYSPIPDPEQVRARAGHIFERRREELPGIDLNQARQYELAQAIAQHYGELPFGVEPRADLRYWMGNGNYGRSDGIFLYGMIRHLAPRRIVEVGSGHSSCVMLDTSERFFNGAIELTFIDPCLDTWRRLTRPGDADAHRLIERQVQDVELEVFTTLEENDILFIDSSHCAKTGSDVNHLFFDVLPSLRPGVYVHLHDVVWPFEYPEEMVYGGWAWNEAYFLRAFLSFNRAFSIQLYNTYLELFQEAWFREHMPLCMEEPGGSVWLRREP